MSPTRSTSQPPRTRRYVRAAWLRHVSVTASALATLGELTGGRVALGIGAGDSAVETVGNRPSRLAALETAIRTIRQLVSGEEVELGQGAMRLDWVGGQRIPIIIGASGPKLLRLAGKVADGAKICHCRNRCGMSRSGAAARHVGRASGLDYSPHSESRRSSCHPSYLCTRDHECGIGEPGRTDSGGKVGGMWRAAFNPGSTNLQHYLLTVHRPFRDLYASSIRSKVTQNARPFY